MQIRLLTLLYHHKYYKTINIILPSAIKGSIWDYIRINMNQHESIWPYTNQYESI